MVSVFFTAPGAHRRSWSAVARLIFSSSKYWGTRTPSVVSSRTHHQSSSSIGACRSGDVDAEGLGGAEGVVVELAQLDLLAGGEHLHVQAEALHLLDEHLEGLGDSRFRDVLALHDCLVP